MRFLRLELRAFGPFADSPAIDLSGGSHGFHLIHGPNEAGKSSALRAIRALLFGFPPRTVDDHRHAYKDLRVGAIIRDEQGGELAFLRRKGDVRTIRTLDDEGLIAEETLAGALGGLDQSRFDELFAMDHTELVAGGRGIVEGKGNLGSILFAAGSGVAGIEKIRQALDAEMEELFKPTGKNPSINAALAELKLAREASEKAMLATSDWVDLDGTIASKQARKEAIDAEARRVEAEKRRLERLRDALPVVAGINNLIGQLAGFGDAPVLTQGFADRRREATAARQGALKAKHAAETALDDVARDLDDLGPCDRVLDEAEAIGQLRDDLGLYRKALEARPIEQARLARLEADTTALLLELRPGGSLEDAGSHRIPAALKERVQGLAQELAGLDAGCANAGLEVARLLEGSPGVDRLALPPDALRLAESLGEAVKQAQALGDLEAQLTSSRAELARLERQSEVELHGLPLWTGSLQELETLPVPSTATLDRFDADFRAAEEALDRVASDLAKLETDKTAIDREIDREQVAGPSPTEANLVLLRTRRDDEWRTIRRAWLDREPIENPARVADEFETAVRVADDLADRLRREADAVAEQAQRQWRRRELLDQIAAQIVAVDNAKRELDRINGDWHGLWKPLAINDPLPPREMKDWVTIRRADLIRQAKGLRDRRLELDQKSAKSEEVKAGLSRRLVRLGEPPADPIESLAALLARACATIDRVNVLLRLDLSRSNLAKAEAAREAWKARWASAVEPLGLLADSSPSQAINVVARFETLEGMTREVLELRGKIEDQAQVEARFEAVVRGLVDRLGVEPESADQATLECGSLLPLSNAGASSRTPGNVSVETVAREITTRFELAQVVEGRRVESLKRQKNERAKLDEARAAVDRADATLEALVAEAGCGSPDSLIEAERTSDELQALKKELKSHELQLVRLAGPIPLDKLREQLDGADPETLEARIAELEDQLDPLQLERDLLAEEIGRCRQKLDAMDGGPAAADAQQTVEERVARLAIDVERYASLRLASAVLREAVERYRKEHQGPVLDRAGALFASLTAGSFAGLRTELDDKGQPVLLGVRSDGATFLKVEGMSEGTADQLYLALRLASLQTYLDNHEPIPLVVDDVLVNFDNARALAALKALAELSKRTQVLFFTHHDHLAELARSALGEDVLFVHHLTFPPVSVIVNGHGDGLAVDLAKPKRKKKASPTTAED
jgi:uncharacterized protein YhaN